MRLKMRSNCRDRGRSQNGEDKLVDLCQEYTIDISTVVEWFLDMVGTNESDAGLRVLRSAKKPRGFGKEEANVCCFHPSITREQSTQSY